MSAIRYLATEQTLGAELGTDINYPIRLFDLDGLGIAQERFLRDLAPSFAGLAWDYYDVARMMMRMLHDHYAARREVPLDPAAIGPVEMQELIEGLPPRMEAELEAIKPYRRRAAARFVLARDPDGDWRARRIPVVAFVQEVAGSDWL